MPIGSQVIYNAGDLILSTVSSSGNTFVETKIAAATSSVILFNNSGSLTSASLSSLTVGNAISSSYALTASFSLNAGGGSGTVSGTTNYIAKFTSPTSVGTSSIYETGSNVGIGTTDPQYKLDVRPAGANARVGIMQYGSWPSGPTYAYMQHSGLNSLDPTTYAFLQESSGETFFNAATGQVIHFRIGNVEAAQINTSRYLGIGHNNNPINAKLEVSGSANEALFNVLSTNKTYTLFASGSGRVGIGTNVLPNTLTIDGNVTASSYTSSIVNAVGFLGTASYALNALTASAVSVVPSNVFVQGGNSFGTTALLGTNDAQSLALETNGTTRMSINSNGNVAINTSTSGFYRLNIADTHNGSAGSASLFITTVQNQGLATSANDSGINNAYYVNNFTSSTAIQNQASFDQLYINGSGSFSGSYRASRNGINISNTASLDSGGSIINTYLTNQISPNIPTFSIPNWIAGTGTFVDIITGNSTGSINNLYNHQIGSPFSSGGAGGITVNNSYGVYINKQKTTNIVTNGWGIYQADTGDLNIFAGKTRIGSTTTPVNTLDVTGNISASVVTASLFGTASWATNASTASYVSPSGNAFIQGGNSFGTTALLGTNDASALIFETNGTGRVTIDTNGNVGIGTTSPAFLLDVSGSSRHGFTSTNTHQFTGSVSLSDGLSLTNLTASNISASGYIIASKVTSSNVLINGNLTVSGSIFASLFSASYIYITSSTLIVTDNIITLNALSPFQRYAGMEMYDSGSGNLSSFLWDGQGDYFFVTGSGVNSKIIVGPDQQTNLTSGKLTKATGTNIIGDSIVSDNGNGIIVGGYISGSSVMTGNITCSNISASNTGSFGIVGIGTSTPIATLEVDNGVVNMPILNLGGGVAANNVSDLYVLNSYNTASGVGYAAKVIGVNISSSLTADNIPIQRTVWSGVTSATALVLSTDDPASGPQDNAFQIWTTNDGVAGTALTQKFCMTSAGNVGIGTTSPNNLLTVSGNASIGSNYNIAAPTNGLLVEGNVGVGTTSPTAKLHIYASGSSVNLLKGVTYNDSNASFYNSSLEYYDTSTTNASTVTKYNCYSYFNKRGTANITGYTIGNFFGYTQIDSGSASQVWDYSSRIEVRNQATASSLYHFIADSGYVVAQGGVLGKATDRVGLFVRSQNQSAQTLTNQYAIYVEDLTGSVSNYGFYSNISSAGNKYNVYAVGSADNYFAGNVGVGTSTPATKLTSYVGSGTISGINDAIRLQVPGYSDGAKNTIVWAQDSGNFVLGRYGLEWNFTTSQMNFVWRDVYNNGVTSTELMRLTGGGTLGIGTSSPSAAFLLDVSGSSRHGFTSTNVHQFTGSVNISGSLNLAGSFIYDNAVLMDYGKVSTPATSTNYVVLQNITGSYNAAFFDYFASSASNFRAGTVIAGWSGSNINYTEYSTTDIGNTNQLTMSVDLSSGYVRLLTNVSTTTNWSVKTSGRYL